MNEKIIQFPKPKGVETKFVGLDSKRKLVLENGELQSSRIAMALSEDKISQLIEKLSQGDISLREAKASIQSEQENLVKLNHNHKLVLNALFASLEN